MKYFKHAKSLVGKKARIGAGTRVWAFANVMDGATVGSDCNICDGCFVESGAVVGDHVTLKNHVSVWAGITLEDGVFVGPNATFVNDRFPRSRNPNWKLERTTVRKGASIGANATIMCGLTVGDGALVGAGSVVTKDVPAYAVIVGNPARQVGWAGRDGQILDKNMKSPSGKQYRMTGLGPEPIKGRGHA